MRKERMAVPANEKERRAITVCSEVVAEVSFRDWKFGMIWRFLFLTKQLLAEFFAVSFVQFLRSGRHPCHIDVLQYF
jgi:hypothetical protein